jgi:adenylate cyclase
VNPVPPSRDPAPPEPPLVWVLARAQVVKARHDLRNPIGDILGYSEMLQEEVNGTPQAGLVTGFQSIHRTATQILKEVDHRLDLSNPSVSSADCDTLMAVIRELSAQISGRATELAQQCGAGGGSIVADLHRIAASARKLREIAPELLGEILPLRAGKPVAPDPDGDTAFFTRDARPARNCGTLLVVEDNESNRTLLRRRLERQGYEVVTVDNGRTALELLRDGAFDLVLLDIMMPELDGHQVLAQMKQDERLRHLPVIMISALDDLASLVSCIQVGADDYLTKPFDPVLLSARIGACLEKKRLRDCEVKYLRQIEEEKKHSNALLRVILPDDIATELKASGRVKPRRHDNVGVLFCDVVGFTSFCSQHEPEDVVAHLQSLFQAFEQICERYGLEKIKTIGDGFMAAGGLMIPVPNPALDCVACGLAMLDAVNDLASGWKVRIGVHSGPVVAGVVGSKKYLFDIWGDTVNTAARVMGVAQPGTLAVSAGAWSALGDQCEGFCRGTFAIKGKGDLEIFQPTRVVVAAR